MRSGVHGGSQTTLILQVFTPGTLKIVWRMSRLISVTRAMLPLLERSAAPRVVNLSSRRGSIAEAALRPPPGPEPMAYFASKAAVNAVTVAFAKRLAPHGGKVNAVAPGRCATDMTGNQGPRSAADGARIAVAMAMLGDDGPTGAFLSDDGAVAW